jgi:hypothetical protein
MGKGSRQSKQRRQTSKNESQTETTNEERVPLTVEQANIFSQLIKEANQAQAQLNFAVASAGLSNQTIIGGHLDGEEPYLVIQRNAEA